LVKQFGYEAQWSVLSFIRKANDSIAFDKAKNASRMIISPKVKMARNAHGMDVPSVGALDCAKRVPEIKKAMKDNIIRDIF
jgi:hypothetical protein